MEEKGEAVVPGGGDLLGNDGKWDRGGGRVKRRRE